jgi:hypothetical protein
VREIYGADNISRESAVAGVVFTQFLPDEDVLKKGKETVEDIFIHRHTPS